jgi:hypothetical protein
LNNYEIPNIPDAPQEFASGFDTVVKKQVDEIMTKGKTKLK